MKSTTKPKWTSSERSQVAKRKQHAYFRSFVRLTLAAAKASPAFVTLGDHLTPTQCRVFNGEADALGMTGREYF